MREEETTAIYVAEAEKLESQGKLKQAEKLFVLIDQPDLAINMYNNHKQFNQVSQPTLDRVDLFGY